MKLYFPHRHGDYILASNRKSGKAISHIQAWRIIHAAVVAVNIPGKIACHSLRKTWGYHAWTSQAVSTVVIIHIFNHSNYEVTRRYLGIAQDDLDNAYLSMDLFYMVGEKQIILANEEICRIHSPCPPSFWRAGQGAATIIAVPIPRRSGERESRGTSPSGAVRAGSPTA